MRCRVLLGLSLDRLYRAGPGGELPARPLPGRQLPGAGPRGGDAETGRRALSRRRAADLDLRHGAHDGHGGARARARPGGNPPPQHDRRARVPVPNRVGHRLGPLQLPRRAGDRVPRDRLRHPARRAGRSPGRRPAGRHRHRLLFRAHRARLADLRGARHAGQHRHRDRLGRGRRHRRGDRHFRRPLAGPGDRDHAQPDRRRRARRRPRRCRGHDRRQRHARPHDRHLCEPRRGAWRRRRDPRRPRRARKDRPLRRPSARSRRDRHRDRRRRDPGRRHRPVDDAQGSRPGGLFRDGPGAQADPRRDRQSGGDKGLRPVHRDRELGDPYRNGGNRPRDMRRDGDALCRGRGLRPGDQPADRRRPGAWRHRPGHRRGADGRNDL